MAGRAHRESAERVSRCVTALLRGQPFFGSLALRLPIRADAGRKTLASDGREIRYAPDWVAETDAHLIETAIARVVLACALKHHTRRGERDPNRWQRASQLVNLQVTAVDDTSASVTWDAVEHATSYDVSWSAESSDALNASAGDLPGVTGTTTTIDHGAPVPMTLTVTVTPEYVDKNGDTQQLASLAGTATLAVGPGSDALSASAESTDSQAPACVNNIVRERLVRDGAVHGPAMTVERLVSRGYTSAEKTLAANYRPGDTVAFHRPYKRLGVEKGDELRVAGVDHRTRTVNLEGADDRSVAWEPNRIAARAGGVEVYRSEEIELRAGDRIRWTRNDAGLGLVNSGTAEVAAVRGGHVAFRLEDGRTLDLAPGDPQLRHVDRAWASTVHAFQGRTVDTVIAAMEANHPHLTTQKSFYVEISRARDRAELVTDDRAALKEQLETATGERIAALEAVGPEKAKGQEAGLEAGRSAGRESGASVSRERDRTPEPEIEGIRAPKGMDRDLGL